MKNLIFLEILIVIGSTLFYMASTRATRRDIGHLPGIVIGLMAVIGFLSPKLIIAHIAIALIPLIFGRTKLRVGMILAIGLFALPALQTDLRVGGAWLFPWTIQTTLSVSALIAFLIAPGPILRAPPLAHLAMTIIIAVLIVVEARGGPAIGYLRSGVTYAFSYVIPVFVITRSARNAIEWRTLLTAMAGAGVILAIVVLYEARAGWPLYSPVLPHYGFKVNVFMKWRGGMMRAYGPMQEATAMGFVLVIYFAAALAARRSFISDTAYIAIVSIIALGTLAPQSRGGMIGIAVAFIVSSFYRRGIGSMAQMGAAGLLLTGAYLTATTIGSSLGNQITTSLNEANGSGDYRSELLRRGLQEFWKSPIFGDSYTNVVSRMQDMVQGEGIVDFVNTYLYFALFAGGIGLIFICVAFFLPISRLIQIRPLLPPASAERELAGFCIALLSAAVVMLAFTSFIQRPTIFLLVATTLATMVPLAKRARLVKKPVNLRVKPSDGPIAA